MSVNLDETRRIKAKIPRNLHEIIKRLAKDHTQNYVINMLLKLGAKALDDLAKKQEEVIKNK